MINKPIIDVKIKCLELAVESNKEVQGMHDEIDKYVVETAQKFYDWIKNENIIKKDDKDLTTRILEKL